MALAKAHDPSEIVIDSVTISSDRLGTQQYDVTMNVIEINIFESLDELPLNANISLLDDNAILESIDFQGEENVHITCRYPDGLEETWTRHFICTAVNSVKDGTNEQSQVFTLQLVDKSGYRNMLTNVNRKYDGNPRQIISQVLAENFRGKQLFTNDNVFQGSMRVIVPNWTPYQTMKWVRNRTTSPSGAPFYCYSVHADEHVRFFDLETMLSQSQMGDDYYYSEHYAQGGASLSNIGQSYIIKGIHIPKQEDMQVQIRDGNVGAQYGFLDTQNFYDNSFKFDITRVFLSMLKRTKIVTERKTPVFDARFTVDDRTLQSYSSRNFTNIGTTSMYNDIPGYYEDVSPEHHSTKAIAKALRKFLFKTRMTVAVSGRNFFMPGENLTTSIGSVINLNFLDKEPIVSAQDIAEHTDFKRSGKYLIYNARYIIKKDGVGTKVDAILELVKLSNTEGTARII